MVARKKGLRPAVGSVCSVFSSSVLPTEAFDVSTAEVWPSTVTASARLPTSSVKSWVRNCWVPIRMPLFSIVLKPCIETLTV
jgi:hypothetical protein